MNYKLIETEEEIKNIEMMASIIWPITYKDILSPNQIQYMLNKYLSSDAIKENIVQNNTYILLFDHDNKNKIGFATYLLTKDKIFLSKLYLLPLFQNQGYASMLIEFLKSYKMPIELTVNKKNKAAYEKYIHLGFKCINSIVTDIGNNFYMDDYVLLLN